MKKTRLLLVEDDLDHQRLLRRVLEGERRETEVRVVSCRDELLECLGAGPYDCVVMDYNLDSDTAPEVLRDAGGALGETPVVMISASEEPGVVIESLRTGVQDFIPKGSALHGHELWERIDAAIRKAELARSERRESNRRMRELARAAETDALTGLRNRRYASRVLESDRSRRDRRTPTSCVMVDVDHFKSINDRFGHRAGDRVLVGVARLLQREARNSDSVIRWGGEEFLVLQPSTDMSAAWVWAEGVRWRLERLGMELGGERITVAASFGVATIPTSQLCEGSVVESDRAMYLAKELGRNRVCTSEMVRLLELAESIRSEGELSGEARLERFLAELNDRLGPVQREHVGAHCEFTCALAAALAERLGITGEARMSLIMASMVHDIGKVAIPESLLGAPRHLEEEERRVVNEHACFGAELAMALGMPRAVARVVAAHHCRFDEDALRDVPDEHPTRLARVLSVADAQAAMMTDRPHARRRTAAEALGELQHERGRQFDPIVVDAVEMMAFCGARGNGIGEGEAEKRGSTRRSESSALLWREPGEEGYKMGWALEGSETGVAFAWRGEGVPEIGTRIEFERDGMAETGIVRRIRCVHDDLRVIAVEVEREAAGV